MPRRIEIDDELYRYLESKASGFETPNDVLRRELRPASAFSTAPATAAARVRAGALAELIAAGFIKPGDHLEHVQPRRRRRFDATVEADGSITTELGTYPKPSPALSALTGGSINGWDAWTHQPSGRTINELKADCERAKGSTASSGASAPTAVAPQPTPLRAAITRPEDERSSQL